MTQIRDRGTRPAQRPPTPGGRVLWTVVRKELLANLLTLRLAVALAFAVLLSVMAAVIGSAEYSANLERFEAARTAAAEELAQATVWQQVEPQVFVPPQPLSILCRGLSEGAGRSWGVELHFRQMVFWPITGASSDLMQSLVRIDYTTVVALLLSFLAVVLGYDGICGERERGTLQLVMTNPVPRGTVVAGKLLGGLLSLWVPLALSFTAVLLILLANPEVSFHGEDWVRLALFFLLSCLYLGQMFTFSLAVSALTRDSATSLTVCLFFWLVAAVGWANVLPSLSRYGVDEPPFQEFLEQNQQLWDEYQRLEEEWDRNHPRPPEAYLEGLDGDGVARYYHPRGYAWMAERNAFLIDKQLEASDRRFRLWKANQDPLGREGLLVDEWGVLSPPVNYQVLSYQLARTTLSDNFYQAQSAFRYRDTYYSWLRDRGAFGDRRWFTDDPPDQEPLIPDPESLSPRQLQPDSEYTKGRRAWMAQQEAQLGDGGGRRLDLNQMPKFGGKLDRTLGESLQSMGPGLLSLLATAGLAALLLMWRFLRYDPAR